MGWLDFRRRLSYSYRKLERIDAELSFFFAIPKWAKNGLIVLEVFVGTSLSTILQYGWTIPLIAPCCMSRITCITGLNLHTF